MSVGKKGRTFVGPTGLLGTGSTRYSSYLEGCWPCAGGISAGESHQRAIAQPDKVETEPMAGDGVDGHTPS